MYEVCWFRENDKSQWVKGVCRLLMPDGALVTADGSGKLVRVTLGNLWLHNYAPTHSQFG